MEYDIRRPGHGVLAEAKHSSSDPRSPTHSTAVNVLECWLKEALWIDFEIQRLLDDEAWESYGVRVTFPDESRAMLEFMSWTQGVGVLDTLAAIGTAYIAHHLRETVERQGSSDALAPARLPRELHVPLELFRKELEAVRAASFQRST